MGDDAAMAVSIEQCMFGGICIPRIDRSIYLDIEIIEMMFRPVLHVTTRLGCYLSSRNERAIIEQAKDLSDHLLSIPTLHSSW